MDVYLLDADWQTTAIIDDFTSLIWRRKYYEAGNFELHCGIDQYIALSSSTYIYRGDRKEAGIIESIDVNDTTCVIKGRFLEALLDRYVIYPTKNYTNKTAAYIAENLVKNIFPYAVSCTAVNSDSAVTSLQVTSDNLMEYTYQLLQTYESSQKITYNFENQRFDYTVYRGLDRRQSQSDNSWAVFSPDWDNLSAFSYSKSIKDVRNFAYVAGAGEGADRVIVTVDLSGDQPVRQLWVDARDLQKEDNMSDDEYKELLKQRGETKLAEYSAVEKCDAEVDPQISLKYLVDFDLGDVCTVENPKLGITQEQRITEIEEAYENSSFKLSVQFGGGYLIVTDYLKRALT